jgi:hypothetical protein
MFRDALREGVARGQLRPMRADEVGVLAHLLMGTRYFVDQMILAGGGSGPSDELMVGTYVRLTRGGLGQRPPGGRA